MRKVHKILKKDHIKNKWLNIGDEGKIPSQLKPEEEVDDEGNSLTAAKIDEVWSSKHGQNVASLTVKIDDDLRFEEDTSKSVTLLEAALKKLDHHDLNPRGIDMEDNEMCMQLCQLVIERAEELFSQFDHNRMNLEELQNTYSS